MWTTTPTHAALLVVIYKARLALPEAQERMLWSNVLCAYDDYPKLIEQKKSESRAGCLALLNGK